VAPAKTDRPFSEGSTNNVSLYLNNIYRDRELEEKTITEEYSTVQIEEKRK